MTQNQTTTYSLATVTRASGAVEGHKGGCRDIKRAAVKDYGPRAGTPAALAQYAYTDDYATKHDVWLDYNADFLAEGSGAYDIHWMRCADHAPQGAPDTEEQYALETAEPEATEPQPVPETKPMTKTEAYAWLGRAREDVLEAKMGVYRAVSTTNLRESLLDGIGALTMLLDALDGDGINGITD